MVAGGGGGGGGSVGDLSSFGRFSAVFSFMRKEVDGSIVPMRWIDSADAMTVASLWVIVPMQYSCETEPQN